MPGVVLTDEGYDTPGGRAGRAPWKGTARQVVFDTRGPVTSAAGEDEITAVLSGIAWLPRVASVSSPFAPETRPSSGAVPLHPVLSATPMKEQP